MRKLKWLITGGGGAVGIQLIRHLLREGMPFGEIWATDVRDLPAFLQHPQLKTMKLDVRDPSLGDHLQKLGIEGVVHLASIVTPGKKSNRELEYSVDVEGTRNVLSACVKAGVKQLILTSSGAAYGYWRDNPEWIDETWPVRGHTSFAYSYHKKLVEEDCAHYRKNHPELAQLILRPGTVLGERMDNQITDLFKKPVLLGVKGSESPFVFIWDEELVAIIAKGMREESRGIYNVAGDGKMNHGELAQALGHKALKVSAPLLQNALRILKRVGLTQYGPEQIDFLRYRPVLSNRRLKEEFGYSPVLSSKQCLEKFWHRPVRGLVIEQEQVLPTAQEAFLLVARLDAVVWSPSLQAFERYKDQLSNWVSYFQWQRKGQLIVQPPSSAAKSFCESLGINTSDVQRTLDWLKAQKHGRELRTLLDSGNEVSRTISRIQSHP